VGKSIDGFPKGKLKSRRGKAILISALSATLLVAALGAWVYWWTTHATFDYSLRTLVVLEGERVYPGDFLYTAEHMEGVTADFIAPLEEVRAGRHEVPLTLARGWRTLETAAALYVLEPVEYMRIEFATAGPAFEPADFLRNAAIAEMAHYDIRFIVAPLPPEKYQVGLIPVMLELNGSVFQSMLHVEDRTPPTATPVGRTIPMGEEVVPGYFVADIHDASPIASVAFVSEPDVFAAGEQAVDIAIEDVFGNQGIFRALLTVLPNEIPPVILGTRTIESMFGTPIMYRQGVSAYDAFGRSLDFSVDNSGVDHNVAGRYYATYWVEDCCGLRAEVEVVVHIVSIDPQYVRERVDVILEGLLSEGMTQVEQARAIFNWVTRNVSYSGAIGRESVYEGAFQALQHRRGNCFVYAAISEVMLTRAGIQNMSIARIPGNRTNHRWNLINPDGLGWYHFDTAGAPVWLDRFMFTSSQARDATERVIRATGQMNYYTYDPDLYPDITQ